MAYEEELSLPVAKKPRRRPSLCQLQYKRDGTAWIKEQESDKMKLQVWLVKCKGCKVAVDNLNTKLVMLEKSVV